MSSGLSAQQIAENYSRVQQEIVYAAQRAGRDPDRVHLIVVTKGHAVEVVQAAIQAGIGIFGENYPEEGVAKKLACQGVSSPDSPPLQWHMIGHVQSRKARLVCEHFTSVHSLDSLKLAGRLDRFSAELGRRLPVLLECNVSGEESKYGLPAWDEAGWENLLPELEQIVALPGIAVKGLMTVAPYLDDAEQARPYFRRLYRLQEFLAGKLPQASLDELSMGMSGDFPMAVQEGATWVRIGTAILGQRIYT